MQRSRWGPLAAIALLAAGAVPAHAAMKVSAGQEFVYSGTFDWKVTSPDGPAQTITGPVKLSAVVTESDPAKGYTVILMRGFQPDPKAGPAGFPADAGVATVRYGADLKLSTPPTEPGGLVGAVMQVVSVPLGPRQELKSGDQWRQSETLPVTPIPPVEHVYTVMGETKVGDRSCLNIEKKLAQALPYKRELGGGSFELLDYGQTRCVDPETGLVLSDELHMRGRHSAGARQATLDLKVGVTLQETRQLPADELASRVKQAAAIDRIQRGMFSGGPGVDRKTMLDAAGKEIAAFRKDFPQSPYDPALARMGEALGSMRDMAEREARLQALKGKPAPAFALKNLAGKEQTLGAYRGKVILLNFFASW